jgi:hypothetical protein
MAITKFVSLDLCHFFTSVCWEETLSYYLETRAVRVFSPMLVIVIILKKPRTPFLSTHRSGTGLVQNNKGSDERQYFIKKTQSETQSLFEE